MLKEEYYGWIGNTIFIAAQLFQVIHTFKVKKTNDISFGLQILMIIGNSMYTAFGYIDDSLSLFIGSAITLFLSIVQFNQKIYFDRKNRHTSGYYEIA
jgi:uncharacterized protein with PQ loop repeat